MQILHWIYTLTNIREKYGTYYIGCDLVINNQCNMSHITWDCGNN